MAQTAEVTTTATYLNMDVIVFNQDTAKGVAQILPVALQTEAHMTATVGITELTNFKIDGVPVEEMTNEERHEHVPLPAMEQQDIVMGYSTTTGEPITLREHEAAFATYLDDMDIVAPAYAPLVPELGRAGAWRKVDQIGYYHALQMDWDAAVDDPDDPPVVNHEADLRDYADRIARHRAQQAK